MSPSIPKHLQDVAANEMASQHGARRIPDTEYMDADKRFASMVESIISNIGQHTAETIKKILTTAGLKDTTADEIVTCILGKY